MRVTCLKGKQLQAEGGEELMGTESDSTAKQAKETLYTVKFHQEREKMLQIISRLKTNSGIGLLH